jgi:hypothetical protein
VSDFAADETVQGFRLSPLQHRLWLLQETTGAAPYIAESLAVIEGAVDRGILFAALQSVIERHEILRTTLHRLTGMAMPLQVIAESGTPDFREHDLRNLDSELRDAALNDVVEQAGASRLILIEVRLSALRLWLYRRKSTCSTRVFRRCFRMLQEWSL